MRNNRIWILITDGVSARICSTSEGITRAITVPTEAPFTSTAHPGNKRASEAWYISGGRCSPMGGATAHFTGHIAQILGEAAAERAFDGLVIIAPPNIAGEIERVLAPRARALMIGDVVRDLPAVAPAELTARLDLWH